MAKRAKVSIEILAPKIFAERFLGITFADKEEKAKGRILQKYGLELLENPEKYYYIFHFRIKEVRDGKAYTELKEIECSRDFLNRNVRKGTSKIEGRIATKTKEGMEIIYKPFVIVPGRCDSKIGTKIRKKLQELLESYSSKSTVERIVEDVVADTLQKKIVEEIKKIYPINVFEFRRIEFPAI